MTPEELQATLAQAHREVARLRNALNAIRAETKHIADETAPYSVGAMRAVRIERLVAVALGEAQR
jgi:uncharacterized protein YukE